MLRDFSHAVRSLARSPRFAVAAILALALGIGACTAIVSIAYTVLLKPLPYRDASRLVQVYEKRVRQGRVRNVVSAPDFFDWRSQNRVFADMGAVTGIGFTYAGREGPVLLPGAQATSSIFRVLGIAPLLGRDFLPDEDQPGKLPVAILTHGLWERRFGSDPSIIGKSLELDGRAYQVIGVLPRMQTVIRSSAELWVPLVVPADQSRSQHYLDVYARLAPGVSLDRARTEMETIAARLEQQHADVNTGHGVNVFPLRAEVVGGSQTPLVVLLAAVGLLLMIACANIANLTLAHMAKRRREISIRRALGAGPFRLVRQFFTESLVLAIAGGVLGSLLAMWSIDLLQWAAPKNIPRLAEVQFDWRVAAVAFLISLLTAAVSGLAPALFAVRTDVNAVLKSEERGSASFRRDRLKAALICAEVAIALVLAIGAGLFFQSFLRLQSVNPGFRTENVLTADIMLSRARYPDAQKVSQFFDTLIPKVENLPGVVAVSAAHALPLTGQDSGYSFRIEGRPPAIRSQLPNTRYRVVTPNYFHEAGIALLRGRAFDPRDRHSAAPVVIINQSLAQQHWPNENVIGKRVFVNDQQSLEIVGLIADVKHYGLSEEAKGEMYFPFAQRPEALMTLVIRRNQGPGSAVYAGVRQAVAGVDPQQPILRMRPWDDYLDDTFAFRRFYTTVVAAFSLLALIMAGLGIYGVISYAVRLRTREIGIRMALGARAGNVQWMIVRQALGLAAIGIGAGIAGALALNRLLREVLFGITPTDTATFVMVTVLLAVVAAAASYLPARRAAAVDPIRALRFD